MRTLVQRTKEAQLFIDGRLHCETGCGLLALFGTRTGDSEVSCNYLADKLVNLRIFEDDDGKMNRSALDVEAEIMIVSQFTLYADPLSKCLVKPLSFNRLSLMRWNRLKLRGSTRHLLRGSAPQA